MHTLHLPECDFIQYIPGGVWTAEVFIVTNVKYDPHFWYAKFPLIRSFWDEVLRIREYNANKVIEVERDEAEEEEEEVGIPVTSFKIELNDKEKIECTKDGKVKAEKKMKRDANKITGCLITNDAASRSISSSSNVSTCTIPSKLLKAIEDLENGITTPSLPGTMRKRGPCVKPETECLISF